MKRITVLLVILAILIFFTNCSNNDINEGLFFDSSKISILEPEDNVNLDGVYPVFKWKKEDTEKYDMYVLAISKESFSINEKNVIENFKNIIWIWTPNFEGEEANIKFSDGYKVSFEENTPVYSGGSGSLIKGNEYYFALWTYDKYGKISKSSDEYKFTF